MQLESDAFRPSPETTNIVEWCEQKFGIAPSVFDGYRFWSRPSSDKVWVADIRCRPEMGGLCEAIGVLGLRGFPPRSKPTSVFLQQFAKKANRNVYCISPADALRFLRRETIDIVPVDDGNGYCVVRTETHVLGCGRVRGRQLVSEIPGDWARAFERPIGRFAERQQTQVFEA